MGGELSKLLVPVAGRPVLAHTLDAFLRTPAIGEIVVVVPAAGESAKRIAAVARETVTTKPLLVCPGGETRRASSLAGVMSARGTIVLIHDGARPCVTPDLIERVIDGTRETGACVPVIPLHDTVREKDARRLRGAALPRDVPRLLVQTPQGFLRARVEEALRRYDDDLPDDAEAWLRDGGEVAAVDGLGENVKLTTAADLPLIEAVLARRRAA
jgi:2-C-methyl-D-erythritol 4-phosphate cytidylyltransferase